MGLTKKAMILFDPELYQRLEARAKLRGISTSRLVREAVERYLVGDDEATRKARLEAAQQIISRQDPVIEWDELERLIEEGHIRG